MAVWFSEVSPNVRGGGINNSSVLEQRKYSTSLSSRRRSPAHIGSRTDTERQGLLFVIKSFCPAKLGIA